MTLFEAFSHQAISCDRLGSPFMAQLLNTLARCWPVETDLDNFFRSFAGDTGPAGASLPLRIAGGLHALVLTDQAPQLKAVYPPAQVSDDVLEVELLSALSRHQDFLLNWVQSPPQTNEVRRSSALIPAAAVVRQHTALPVWLSELGASGGLNLMWDHFALNLPAAQIGSTSAVLTLSPEWEGPMPPCALPRVADRGGVDLNPLDPSKPIDLLHLTAYLWPDQPQRLALTKAAASVVDASVSRGDAIDWLEKRLQQAPEAHVHMIQHTVAWQYFPEEKKERGRKLIEAAGGHASPERPLAWFSMESDGDTKGAIGAALTLRFWPGDITLHLGRADFHGRWVKWTGPS